MKMLALTTRNIKEVFRDPVSILLGVFMPLLFLILFSSLNKSIQIDIFNPQYLTPGIIVFSFAFLIMFSAMLLANDKKTAFLTRLFAAPLRPSDFILSYMLPFIPLAMVQVIICMVCGTILGAGFQNLFISFLMFMVMAILCISIGVLLGAVFNVNQASGIGSVIITIISIFSGAWMDLKMLGGVFKGIGYALPFAHGIDVLKALLAGKNYSAVVIDTYWIYGYTAVFFVLAVLAFWKKMRN